MQDYNLYSPLFSMGLSLCNSTPVRQIPCKSKSTTTSFLALDVKRTVSVVDVNEEPNEEIIDIELDVDEIQYIERKSRDYAYAYAAPSSYECPSPSSSVRSTPSPSGRTLPLPKPAPMARLPAIPISTLSPTNSKYIGSAAPSSHILPPSSSYPPLSPSSSDQRKQRKFHSLAPSWMSGPFGGHPYSPPVLVPIPTSPIDVPTDVGSLRTLSTTVSTNYKRKRRSDALAALEGRRRDGSSNSRVARSTGSVIGSSFVPSMVHEEDEDEMEPTPSSLIQNPFSSSAPSLIPSPTPITTTTTSSTDSTTSAPVTAPSPSQAHGSGPFRSHLSLTSTVYTTAASSAHHRPISKFRYDPSQVPQLPELPTDLFILPHNPLPSSSASVGHNSIRSPMSPTFPTSPRISSFAGEAPAPPVVGPARPVWFGRRASTGTTEIGWGMTFMELDDDTAATTPSNGSSSRKMSIIS